MIALRVMRERRRAPFGDVRRDHERAVTAALLRGAAAVREEARAVLSEAERDVSSLPGEPPHRRSGRLRESVFARIDRPALTAVIGSDVAYAVFLEFGTVRMAARPWLAPAFDAAKPTVRRLMAEAIQTALTKPTRRGAVR